MEEIKDNIDSGEEQVIKNDEVDLIEVAKTIWTGRRLIVKVTVIFFAIGLGIAFGSKVEYEASCKLMPESQEGMKPNMGSLGSLAGLAGINLDMTGTGALTPELYPQIAQSVPFILKIWNEPIEFEKQDTTISSYNYFKEIDKPSILSLLFKYTIGLPFQIKKWLTISSVEVPRLHVKNQIIRLNKEDTELLEMFKGRIKVSVDSKTGILSLVSEMPDALAAAELTQLSMNLLTDYVTDYKVSKAQENLEFVQARYSETKTEFENTQKELALFNDRNRNVSTAFGQIELQRLQNEYNLAFEVYKGLASQREQAKIKVKEETPVFTILEPVKVPINKNAPKRMLVILASVMIGVIAAVGKTIVSYSLLNINKHSKK